MTTAAPEAWRRFGPGCGYVIVSPGGWICGSTFRTLRKDCIQEFCTPCVEGKNWRDVWSTLRERGYRVQRAIVRLT